MRIVSWNVNGLNTLEKKCLLRRFIMVSKVDVFMILESKISNTEVEMFKKKCKS